MHPLLFKIGPIKIHTYGFFVFLGILAGWFVLERRTKGKVGKKILEDILFYTIIFAIIGARIFYFLFWDFKGLLENPLSFFYVWQGGLAIFGGILGGISGIYFFSKKYGLGFFELLDWFAPSLALGQAIGRLGCFSAGCCYGKPTDFFLGVRFTDPLSLAPLYVKIHPTQLYESFFDFLLFFILIKTKVKKRGFVAGFYFIGYGIIRFFMEFLRGDVINVFGFLTAMQIFAIIFIVLGAGLIWKKNLK